ncbi:hypothetical protein E2C01_060792 [Portunus trituberculatus]|uniref:Uncharacterized protein n=1 Tax=Portunus trituberculatus TaxID=210409 RepID=A0A5B7H6I1_PORTR|nr:hypothetical protein [Portunus trituberculatus]
MQYNTECLLNQVYGGRGLNSPRLATRSLLVSRKVILWTLPVFLCPRGVKGDQGSLGKQDSPAVTSRPLRYIKASAAKCRSVGPE